MVCQGSNVEGWVWKSLFGLLTYSDKNARPLWIKEFFLQVLVARENSWESIKLRSHGRVQPWLICHGVTATWLAFEKAARVSFHSVKALSIVMYLKWLAWAPLSPLWWIYYYYICIPSRYLSLGLKSDQELNWKIKQSCTQIGNK